MALGLAVTDNLDGTVDYAVTGTVGGPWALAAARWPSSAQALALVEQATGTGDDVDTIAPTPASGPLVWVLTSGSLAPAVYYAPVAPLGDPPHLLAARYIWEGVKIIGVAGCTDAQILFRRLPRPVGTELDAPLVIVSPYPTEAEQPRLSNKDDVVYPVTVAFFTPNNSKLNTRIDEDFMNRWRVTKAFRNQRPNGVPGAAPLQIKWRPDLPTSPLAAAQNVSVGVIVFECGFRETRAVV